jgi:predicted nucleotidyltransferase
MEVLKRKPSLAYYGRIPVIGDCTINTFGKIAPILPLEIRQPESTKRLEYAERIAPTVLDALTASGIDVAEIQLTGSAASGFSGPNSDIDLEVEVEGMNYDEFSPEYDAVSDRLYSIALQALGPPQDRPYRVHIFLANDYRSPRYLAAARGQHHQREGYATFQDNFDRNLPIPNTPLLIHDDV